MHKVIAIGCGVIAVVSGAILYCKNKHDVNKCNEMIRMFTAMEEHNANHAKPGHNYRMVLDTDGSWKAIDIANEVNA